MMAKASASVTSEAVWKTSAMRPPARVPADAGTSRGAIRKAHVLQYLPCSTHKIFTAFADLNSHCEAAYC